jgi:integrase
MDFFKIFKSFSMIGVTGFSGAVGSEFCRYLRVMNIPFIKINLRQKNIEYYLQDTIKKYKLKYIYNFAANLNPKTKEDINLNAIIPKIILEKLNLNNGGILIQISSINTLINDRNDIYSLSKYKSENMLNKSKLKNFKIVRLGLVVKKKKNIFLNFGGLKLFYDYLKIPLPFYPIITPGIFYKPIDTLSLNKMLLKILKIRKKEINIQGKNVISSSEIFEIIAKKYNKKILKIKIPKIFINKFNNLFEKKFIFTAIIGF